MTLSKSFYDIVNQPVIKNYEQSSINKYHQSVDVHESMKDSFLRIRVQEEHMTDRLDNFLKRRKCRTLLIFCCC